LVPIFNMKYNRHPSNVEGKIWLHNLVRRLSNRGLLYLVIVASTTLIMTSLLILLLCITCILDLACSVQGGDGRHLRRTIVYLRKSGSPRMSLHTSSIVCRWRRAFSSHTPTLFDIPREKCRRL
jgi:hypothetical protein